MILGDAGSSGAGTDWAMWAGIGQAAGQVGSSVVNNLFHMGDKDKELAAARDIAATQSQGMLAQWQSQLGIAKAYAIPLGLGAAAIGLGILYFMVKK